MKCDKCGDSVEGRISLEDDSELWTDNCDIYTTEIHVEGITIVVDIPFALWLVQNAYENSR